MEILENSKEKDWAKCYRAVNFIEKGVCTYQDEVVCLSQETLQKCVRDIKGKPVIIKHQRGINPDNMQQHAVGYVTGAGFDEFNASFSCNFVLFDEEAKGKIANGWSVSCAYLPKAFGQGGTWHNTAYDREITDLEFTHLALVPDPRYEDAKVYENAKDDKGQKGKWVTHVFIKEGQSVEDAMKETFKDRSKNKYNLTDDDKRGIDVALAMEKSEWEKRGNEGTPKHIDSVREKIKKDEDLTEADILAITTSLKSTKSKDAEAIAKKFETGSKKELSDIGEMTDSTHFKFKEDKESSGYPRKIHKTIESAQKFYEFKKEGQDKAEEENLKRSGKRGISLRDKPLIVKNPAGEGYIVATIGLKEKYGLEEANIEKQNNKEDEMDVNEFISKITEGVVEKFNACKKNEMEEEDKKKADGNDDELEYEGEKYSKKELVNAFKTMKKNEVDAEAAKKVEKEKEEKENALGEETYKKLEELLNSRKADDESDKIKHESQADRIARGNEIFG